MSSYRVSVGDEAVRVKTLQGVQSVVMEALNSLLTQDPEAVAKSVTMANQSFSVGAVQHSLVAHGIWRMSVTVHGEPVPIAIVKKRWW